ncbi:MAG: pitrilysin family protein [Pseudomonadota bacterium]
MLRRYFIPIILLLAALAAAIYFTGTKTKKHDVRASVPVERFQLSNGLQVVVMPNPRIPVVTHMLVVKAGGADDAYGKSGVAHYMEHLMFAGTKDYPEGTYDRAIARVGGVQNASTNRDYTLFYATVPKEHLRTVMAMEVDRLRNIDFDTAKAARELKIITEERNMRVENNPAAQWVEQLNALTFLNHPYHQPVIGWAEDMATFTAADARAYYEAHYRPGNMILLVAGDVTARDVRRHAQHYYGAMPGGEFATRNWPKEPPIRMARKGEMRDTKVHEPRLLRQYIAPSVGDGAKEDALPLSVFAQYLGGGETSVLYRTLVREQKLASNVSVDYDPMAIGPALFRIVAVPAAGVTLPQLEEALDRALATALVTAPDEGDIANAKTLLKAALIYAQDGLQPLANTMAGLFAIGLDEQYFYSWADNVGQVSAAGALAAGKAVIIPARAVTGYLLPETPAPTAEVPHAQ